MIHVGISVIFRPNSPREFRGHVTSIEAGVARVVGPALRGQHREGRDFALHELHEVAEPPLNITVGNRLKIFGHDARVTDTGPLTIDVEAVISRPSGVEFRRRWTVPRYRLRLAHLHF